MRILAYISALFLLGCLAVVSCVNSRTNARIENSKGSKLTEHGIVGQYVGDMPCMDCDAIATSLTLGSDKGYTLKYQYVGKDTEPFTKTGTWRLADGELHLDGVDYKYKVEADQLRQLDLSGKVIGGELAERYVLHAAR